MKKMLLIIALVSLTTTAKAEPASIAAWVVGVGMAAVVTEAAVKSDKDEKCLTYKKAEDGNYKYAVYTKEACK